MNEPVQRCEKVRVNPRPVTRAMRKRVCRAPADTDADRVRESNKISYRLGSFNILTIYRDRLKRMQILISRTREGPGRAVKQEQEDISPKHIQTFLAISVHYT